MVPQVSPGAGRDLPGAVSSKVSREGLMGAVAASTWKVTLPAPASA